MKTIEYRLIIPYPKFLELKVLIFFLILEYLPVCNEIFWGWTQVYSQTSLVLHTFYINRLKAVLHTFDNFTLEFQGVEFSAYDIMHKILRF